MKDVLFLYEDTIRGDLFYFHEPQHEICAENQEQVLPALEKLNELRKQGYYLAGFVAYEAGAAFVEYWTFPKMPAETPFVHFYAFKEKKTCKIEQLIPSSPISDDVIVYDFQTDTNKNEYFEKQNKIQQLLKDGEIYQLNQTLQKSFKSISKPESLYSKLRNIQKTPYSAFLRFADYEILSFSPELFFKKEGEKLTTEPMKGTAALHLPEDYLKKDEKSIAENLMIVDLLRNDLGRLAHAGSVQVEELFRIQKLSTVYQMTSVISAAVDREESIGQIFRCLFPCGSITGAPKVSAMNWISQLESSTRGVYTGAIGLIEPNNDMCFSVAIRTVVRCGGKYILGVGGGIVTDSVAEKEFEETELKSRFLRQLNSHFFLFETLLFDGVQYRSLQDHLRRLKSSATYFDFELDLQRMNEELQQQQPQLSGQYKIKIELFWNGQFKIKTESLAPRLLNKVVLSTHKISSTDLFRRHKTSSRHLYDQEWKRAQEQGFYDILFLNEKEQLAEASRHNLFIKKSSQWLTPPLSAGALPGIERARTIKDFSAIETDLTVADLSAAEEILLTNSVQGRVPVKWSAR